MLVLLDRDGVINVDLPEGVHRADQFEFLPRAIDGIILLTQAGFDIAVCTNQSAVGKGLTTLEIVHEVHRGMQEAVEARGGKIGAIYMAPEHPDTPSARRKPAPGMLQEALAHFSAKPEQTPMVGDMVRDLEAAKAASCPRILVRTGKGAALEAAGVPSHLFPLTVVDDLFEAAEHICRTYR